MNIIEQIKALPPGIAVDGVITAIIFCSDEWQDFEPIEVYKLLALAESHERLLRAAKGVIKEVYDVRSARMELDAAIEEAEKL